MAVCNSTAGSSNEAMVLLAGGTWCGCTYHMEWSSVVVMDACSTLEYKMWGPVKYLDKPVVVCLSPDAGEHLTPERT